MRISLNDLLYALSYALDCVEHDLIGVTTNHGKRVAYLCTVMGRELGMDELELTDFAGCAILHDNALTEYIQEEYRTEYKEGKTIIADRQANFALHHCVAGEENLKALPFRTDVKGIVLYHHENADGTGPLHKKEVETPLKAQLLHMADLVDANWDFSFMSPTKYEHMCNWILEKKGSYFSDLCVTTFFKCMSFAQIQEMKQNKIDVLLREILPLEQVEYTNEEMKEMVSLFAKIVDYKSEFTRTHSMGIACKAEAMGEFYGFDKEKQVKLYVAGALHDIGKLVVDRDVLEKPDKLTSEEYKHIQNHAFYTYDILRKVDGLGEIVGWAALHHEKFNGAGYPFGKTAEELCFEERLMGCLDIYQAPTEKRPYKDGFSHEKSISILRDMAANQFVDGAIVEDINQVFTGGKM